MALPDVELHRPTAEADASGLLATIEGPRGLTLWDTGHHAYAHKLVPDRHERFHTLRAAAAAPGSGPGARRRTR